MLTSEFLSPQVYQTCFFIIIIFLCSIPESMKEFPTGLTRRNGILVHFSFGVEGHTAPISALYAHSFPVRFINALFRFHIFILNF